MNTLLPFIVIGVANGAVYAIAAMGLVLTYKTSGIFNFAHGAIAAAAAYLFYELHIRHGVPWPIAAMLCVLVAGPLAGLGMELLARRLAQVPTAMKVVATVGLMLAIQGLLVIGYGAATRSFPPFLPQQTFGIAGIRVSYDQLIVVVLALAAAAGLYALLRFTRTGRAMRGLVDDPDLLSLVGTSPIAVRRMSWAIGCSFAAMSGILLAPALGLDAAILTLLVVQAFGAAAVGAFTSLPLTYVGGLVIGIGSAVLTKYVSSSPQLQGLPSSFPFIVLFVALLVVPKRKLVEAGRGALLKVPGVRLSGGRSMTIGGGTGFGLLLLLPVVVGARLPVYSAALVFVVLFLSLGLLVRTSGQVSLCHMAFAAVGAAAFSKLAVGAGLPWLVALLLAGLAAVPLGALVAIPAIRLSGIYLALATFGFGLMLQAIFFRTSLMFGSTGVPTPRPAALGLDTDRGYYYLLVAVVAAVTATVVAVQRSRLGRLLRGMADSPLALATQGTNVNAVRVLVFALSAFLAGVGGALLGPLAGSVNAVPFNAFGSLVLLAVLAVSGREPVRAGFLAAAFFVVVPSYLRNDTLVQYLPVVFGVAAVSVALTSAHRRRTSGSSGTQREGTRAAERTGASPIRERLLATVGAVT